MNFKKPTVCFVGESVILVVPRFNEMLGHYSDQIVVDSGEWYSWLVNEKNNSFIVQPVPSGALNYSCSLELRASGAYWYAYKRIYSDLKRRYLGATEAITAARLLELSNEFSDLIQFPNGREKSPNCQPEVPINSSKMVSVDAISAKVEDILNDPQLTRGGKDRGTVRKALYALRDAFN